MSILVYVILFYHGLLFMEKMPSQIPLNCDEIIIRTIHRSPLSYISRYVIILVFILLPLFFMIPLFYSGTHGIMIFVACFGFALFVFFRVIWSIYRNSLIVTNYHIVDLDKRKFFRTKATKFHLHDVIEVNVIQKGIFAKIFHYGNLVFQIKKVKGLLVLKYVNDPEYIKDLIINVVEEAYNMPRHLLTPGLEATGVPSHEKMMKIMRKIKKTVGNDVFYDMIDKLDR